MSLKSREKMLILFAVIAIAIWAFDRSYYTPETRRLSALKEEVRAADQRMTESLIFAKGVETLEAEVSRLEKELQRWSERMLKGEEFRAFLKHLGRESDRLQMKMITFTSEEEKISPPEEKKVTVASQYKKVNIQMVLHSTFTALETYLKRIEELPFLVTVDNLQVDRIGEITPLLKVTMGLSVYVVTWQ